MKSLSRGLTLIEAVVTVAVVAVLAGVAAPNLTEFIDRQRLVSQTLAIAELAQTARSEAIKGSASGAPGQKYVTLTVNPGPPWLIGLRNGNNTCNSAATCVINQGGSNVPYFVDASLCAGCTLETPVAQMTVVYDFRGVRTSASFSEAGQVLSSDFSITVKSPKGKTLSVDFSPLGRVRVCAPGGNVTGYPTC